MIAVKDKYSGELIEEIASISVTELPVNIEAAARVFNKYERKKGLLS